MPELQTIRTYNGDHENMADALRAIPWDKIKSAELTLRNGKTIHLRKSKSAVIAYDTSHNLVGLTNVTTSTVTFFKTVCASDVTAFHVKQDATNDD